jgi:hypothetical protein
MEEEHEKRGFFSQRQRIHGGRREEFWRILFSLNLCGLCELSERK